MDISSIFITIVALFFVRWLAHLYTTRGSGATDIFRYLGYTFVGFCVGVLIPAYLVVFTNVPLPLSPRILVLALGVVFGLIGFEIARKRPNSFSIASKPSSWGRYAAFTLGGLLIGTMIVSVVAVTFNLSSVLVWTLILLAALIGFLVAYWSRPKVGM